MAEPQAVTFAGLLKQLRVDAELTAEDLAKKAGVSVRTILDLERGVARRPRETMLQQLVAALELTGPARERLEAIARNSGRIELEVDARGSQGVQVGGHDQYNLWLLQHRLDGDALQAFSPRAAARLVAGMPRDDAALLLARAPVAAAAEVLSVLLSMDEVLAIELVAHIKRSRAQELVDTVEPSLPWLAQLPAAAEAVASCDMRMRAALGESTGQLIRADPSQRGTEGFCQSFKNGLIYWSPRGGAEATIGAIAEYHQAHGGSGGRLGFPLSPTTPVERSSFGAEGSGQRFESSSDYAEEVCQQLGLVCGATVYLSTRGAYATWGEIGEYFELHGGPGGRLGFPVGDATEVRAPEAIIQPFERGVIYYREARGAVAVSTGVADYLGRRRGIYNLGFPVSHEQDADDSPYGTTGRFQRFAGGWLPGVAIYATELHGIYMVYGSIGELHEGLGGSRSWLGFPKSDEDSAPVSSLETQGSFQIFEGGEVFLSNEYGSVAVPGATMEIYQWRLGFPITAEWSLVSEDDVRLQFFEHGVVTVRTEWPSFGYAPPETP